MAKTINKMDKTTISMLPVYRSEVFRTPFGGERKLGLWVDRIGKALDTSGRPSGLRLLGLFCAVYIIKGRGRFITRMKGELRVKAGDVMLLFPNEPHQYTPDTAWQTRWVVWGGPEAAALQETGYLHPRQPVVRDSLGGVSRAYDELGPVMAREDLAAVLYRKQVLLRMILDLYTGQRSGKGANQQAERMREAMAFIGNNCTRNLSVPDLAGRSNMSVTHFRRVFRQYTGRSPNRYITFSRVSMAKRYLAEGMSIQEAAAAAGYDDEFYFMRVFKKISGQTA
ncbi:AraC family transcriptional regulator, partial [Planctomycetota bacterium]